ncbi:MAG TPA: tripartite tricarboxylate transporter substrate binding protein [Burkholderiales bacterium]|nr:tripartite tricarboxylate transporter substrate binding protein [Burkholderiales bacterium]
MTLSASGRRTTRASWLFAVLAASVCVTTAAQPYPERPIRFVVAFPPGASTDIVGRIVSQKLTESWGQNVVVENRPGAGGNIGTQTALRANPDGYTILLNSSAFAVNVSLYSTPGYKVSDFVPIVQGPTTPNLISVHPSVKAATLAEPIALARSSPMNYGSSGTGTTPHLDMELLFKTLAKVPVTHVPYGPAQAVSAVVGNQVPIASTSMPPAVPHVKAGRVRPIAVTTIRRSNILPDTPTVAESGYSGFDDHTWFSFFAPAGTPPAIVNKLNAEVNRILQLPDVKARLDVLSLEFVPNTPAEFAARLKAEVARYAKMVRDSGAKAD